MSNKKQPPIKIELKTGERKQENYRRRGYVFSIRITDEERAALETLKKNDGKPWDALGPWLVKKVLAGRTPGQVLGITGDRR